MENQDDDYCGCGGIINPVGTDEDGILNFKCEKCGKIYYDENSL